MTEEWIFFSWTCVFASSRRADVQRDHVLHVPAHKAVVHCGLDEADEVPVAREDGGHQGEDMPVSQSADLQHDRGLLLDGSPNWKKVDVGSCHGVKRKQNSK